MTTEQSSAQAYQPDARNDRVQVYVNGAFFPRDKAVVSVFDSGFVLGDGIWEGLRVRGGHPAFLETHLDRLYDSAKALLRRGRARRTRFFGAAGLSALMRVRKIQSNHGYETHQLASWLAPMWWSKW